MEKKEALELVRKTIKLKKAKGDWKVNDKSVVEALELLIPKLKPHNKNITEVADIKITTRFRESTAEWLGEFVIDSELYDTISQNKYTAKTEREGLLTAFSALAGELLNMTLTK